MKQKSYQLGWLSKIFDSFSMTHIHKWALIKVYQNDL